MALEKRIADFEKALNRLKESYNRAVQQKNTQDYPLFRDSAIQRFEFTTEILWKTLKEFLREKEGIECKSPKGCIREFFSTGYLTSEETMELLEMIDNRSKTSHTYHEEIAEEIFSSIRKVFSFNRKVLNTIY